MAERETNLLENMVITRIFDAPRELVWKAWTDPELVMQWWGLKGFTSPSCEIDLRVGGRYLYCMRSPEGQEFFSGGEYTEIKAPERIVSVLFYADRNGKVEPADGNDVEVRDVVTFEEVENGRTKLTFKRSHWDVGEDEGSNEIFDKLAVLVAKLAKAK
ncbi:MAG TPA: SRPBCC domain-containing protein [Spirochaetia bacterium]|nr:SRPBCC domain-containing protein [Spirochaetia bacterium]